MSPTMQRPPASSEAALARMKAARPRDTAPELALRSRLHRMGLRYFVDHPPLAGMRRRADVVFPIARVAVYVDGCFWHGCPIHGTRPKANARFWSEKIETNRHRDADTDRELRDSGWTVLRFWAHDDPDDAAAAVQAAIMSSRKIS
jgi:DNA mismatch endonuclease (patch repair protein)